MTKLQKQFLKATGEFKIYDKENADPEALEKIGLDHTISKQDIASFR